MSKFISAKFVLLFFLFGILGATDAAAQASSCALKLEVSVDGSGVSLKGATATATNADTKRVYRSALRNGFPYFAKLPDGEYDLSVTRAGYKRTVDNYIVMCDLAEAGVLTADIEMQKGSPRQTFTIMKGVPEAILSSSEETVKIGRANNPNDTTTPPPPPAGEMINGRALPGRQRTRAIPKIISKGVLNGSAVSLPKPPYPPAARAVRADGTVMVQVTLDENGNVITATAASGHPLLQQAAVSAARQAKFRPTLLSGTPVKVMGVIVYNFIAPEK